MKISFDYGTERRAGRLEGLYPECGTSEMNATRADKVEALDIAEADPKAVEAIGRALEAHYSSLIKAPLPSKFVELLAKLEQDQTPRNPGSPDALG